MLCVTMMIVRPSWRFKSRSRRDDLAAGLGVEVAGRLVGEQDARPVDEGAGDGGALHLAAGQLARPVVQPAAEADAVEQLDGPVAQPRDGGRATTRRNGRSSAA